MPVLAPQMKDDQPGRPHAVRRDPPASHRTAGPIPAPSVPAFPHHPHHGGGAAQPQTPPGEWRGDHGQKRQRKSPGLPDRKPDGGNQKEGVRRKHRDHQAGRRPYRQIQRRIECRTLSIHVPVRISRIRRAIISRFGSSGREEPSNHSQSIGSSHSKSRKKSARPASSKSPYPSVRNRSRSTSSSFMPRRQSQRIRASATALQQHLLGLGDRFGRIQALGTGVGAIHDRMAAI